MAYRRTDNVLRRLAARHDAIVAAARAVADDGGMAAVQIAPVAARASIATGTVYRYFPGKLELIAALVEDVSRREIAALRRAAEAAPGPLSALAAVAVAFGARALRHRRLAWAVVAEPVDGAINALRLTYRKALAAEFERRIAVAIAGGHLPEQDAALAAAAAVGALLEGLIGPLAPDVGGRLGPMGVAVLAVALNVLRGLGVADAHARGLVAQTTLPAVECGDGRAAIPTSPPQSNW
jgi:AcrR family transcriptional regulator